jgi:hypothetical protein
MKIGTVFLLLAAFAAGSFAQAPTAERQQFIRVEAPVVVLTHVRIIDGTGAAARDDQTIVIAAARSIDWGECASESAGNCTDR